MRYVIGVIVFIIIGIGLYSTIQDKKEQEQEMRKAQAEFVEAYMAEYQENKENQGPTLYQDIFRNYGDLEATYEAIQSGAVLPKKENTYNYGRDELQNLGAAKQKFRESQE